MIQNSYLEDLFLIKKYHYKHRWHMQLDSFYLLSWECFIMCHNVLVWKSEPSVLFGILYVQLSKSNRK